ncbi:MAG: hypothetical protein ACI8RD_006516 [Bacillariaceae sp.]|jgi:hypothetical protein
MTALVAPAFQTKSKRDLFSHNDEIIEFNTDQDASCIEEIKIECSNEQNVDDNTNNNNDNNDNNDNVNEKEIAATVPSIVVPDTVKVVPATTTTTKTSSSPKNKNAAAKGNFFSRLFGIGGGTKRKTSHKRHTTTSKGVYYDTRTGDVPSESLKTIDTATTNEVVVLSWVQSDLENHQKDVPIVVRRPAYDIYNEADDKKLLKKILLNCKKLPQDPGKYASNHIMINAERLKRNIPPLRRERHMDQIAREQAQLMAEERKLFQIDTPTDLQNRLIIHTDVDLSFQRTGMNIGRGKSISEIHKFMMAALAERNNIHDKRFFTMGMGTARAENGVLYLCQIFGGG